MVETLFGDEKSMKYLLFVFIYCLCSLKGSAGIIHHDTTISLIGDSFRFDLDGDGRYGLRGEAFYAVTLSLGSGLELLLYSSGNEFGYFTNSPLDLANLEKGFSIDSYSGERYTWLSNIASNAPDLV